MATTETAPRWDLTPIFAGTDDRAFAGALEGIYAGVDRLVALYDELDIRDQPPRPVTDADVAALESVISDVNDLQTQMRIVSTYLYALVTTDTRNDAANADMVELQTRSAALGPLMKRLGAWLAVLGVDEFAARSDRGRRARVRAARRRPRTPSSRWAKPRSRSRPSSRPSGVARVAAPPRRRVVAAHGRHGRATASIERVPMALARGLATHPDAARRRAAYDGELAAWATVAVPLAAALNGAKGELAVLNRRRGFADDLEPALRCNNVDRAHARRDDRRRRRLAAGLPSVPPRQGTPARSRRRTPVVGPVRAGRRRGRGRRGRTRPSSCTTRSAASPPTSAGLATRAFDEHWVDAEIRDGKRGGAYCVSVDADVSRVMMNFDGSHDSVSTLAHELGHAFHNVALAERTPMQRRMPMALAETASIFCETLLFETRGRARRRRRRTAGAARHLPRGRDRRSSSTSTAGSCSRASCAGAGGAPPCRWPS